MSLSSRFQDVKEYADELESVFKSLLAIREVGRVRVQGSEVKVHSSRVNRQKDFVDRMKLQKFNTMKILYAN